MQTKRVVVKNFDIETMHFGVV